MFSNSAAMPMLPYCVLFILATIVELCQCIVSITRPDMMFQKDILTFLNNLQFKNLSRYTNKYIPSNTPTSMKVGFIVVDDR